MNAIPFAGLAATAWMPIARRSSTKHGAEWSPEPGDLAENIYDAFRRSQHTNNAIKGVVATARIGTDFVLMWQAAK